MRLVLLWVLASFSVAEAENHRIGARAILPAIGTQSC